MNATESQIHVFGVRHLSPSGAWHLRAFLDRVRPKVVLIEGLSDANGLIPDITRKDTRPPIAILAYTDSLPVRTLVYPIARYSPEYQALLWGEEHDVRAEFIDLPSDIFLALQDTTDNAIHEPASADETDADHKEEDEHEDSATDAAHDATAPPATPEGARAEGPEKNTSLYERFAQIAGEYNYETYWERHFEHNLSDDSY